MSKKQDKQSLAANQLAAQLAALSQLFSQPGSASSNYGATLQDTAQGAASAQADYIARKKAKEAEKKKGLGGMIGGAVGLSAAPFTGGASLAAVPGLMTAGQGVASGDYAGAVGGLASAGTAGMDAGLFSGGAKATPMANLSTNTDPNMVWSEKLGRYVTKEEAAKGMSYAAGLY